MHSFFPPFSQMFDMFHHFPNFPPVSHISFFPPFFQHVPSFLPHVSPKCSYKILPPFWTFPLKCPPSSHIFLAYSLPFFHMFPADGLLRTRQARRIPARQPRRKLSAGSAKRNIFTQMWVKQCHEPLHVGNGDFLLATYDFMVMTGGLFIVAT